MERTGAVDTVFKFIAYMLLGIAIYGIVMLPRLLKKISTELTDDSLIRSIGYIFTFVWIVTIAVLVLAAIAGR